MSSPPTPSLSVVIVSFSSPSLLTRCLTSLAGQAASVGAEILVVRAGATDPALSELIERGTCRWISAPAGETVPRLRRRGLEAAQADVVALLEDDCVVSEDWCRQVLLAHRGDWVAVGGAVEPGQYARAIDWAIYFYEYGRFMLPFDAHRSSILPGNNVSYKRQEVVSADRDPDGFYDVFVHQSWREAGRPMLVTPTLVVTNGNSWALSYVLISPFHHGRGFAAKRVIAARAWRRFVLSALMPFLPVAQTYRIVRHTVGQRRLIGRLFLALPWIGVFATSWAAGECVGYLLGPGRSVARWR